MSKSEERKSCEESVHALEEEERKEKKNQKSRKYDLWGIHGVAGDHRQSYILFTASKPDYRS